MEKIETEHGIFTSNSETGQTAEEVYQEWLKNRNNQSSSTITIEERLLATQKMVLSLQEQIIDII